MQKQAVASHNKNTTEAHKSELSTYLLQSAQRCLCSKAVYKEAW